MDDSFGVKAGNPIPGEVMHEYFKQYAQRADVLRRIDFETEVLGGFATRKHKRLDGQSTKAVRRAGDADEEAHCCYWRYA